METIPDRDLPNLLLFCDFTCVIVIPPCPRVVVNTALVIDVRLVVDSTVPVVAVSVVVSIAVCVTVVTLSIDVVDTVVDVTVRLFRVRSVSARGTRTDATTTRIRKAVIDDTMAIFVTLLV